MKCIRAYILYTFRDELKKCNQYNIYNDETFKVIGIIKNEWNRGQQQTLVDLYNDIYKTDRDFKKIIYALKVKGKYTVRKLNENIKKLVLEYKDISNCRVAFEGSLSFFRKPMDDYIEWF